MSTTTIKAIDATITSTTLVLAFGNGESITISAGQLSDDIRAQCMMHGLKQKLVDAAAISRNPDTGRSATIDDKLASVNEVATRLLSGQWNKVREGGTGGGAGGLLFRAMCIAYPAKSPDDVRSYLATKTPAQHAEMRATEKLAAIIATLRTVKESDDSVLPDWE